MFLILIMHILFCAKIKKMCYRNKWLNLKAYLLTEETSSWFPLTESLKIIWKVPDPTLDSWDFIKRRGFGLFFTACLTQTQWNNCDLSKVVNCKNRVSFDLPKVTSTLNCSKWAKWPIWKSISPVTKKLETSNLDNMLTSLKRFH